MLFFSNLNQASSVNISVIFELGKFTLEIIEVQTCLGCIFLYSKCDIAISKS
jgi:hypothetical protein